MLSIAELFGRSPFGPLREHMGCVCKCTELVPDLMAAVLAGDRERTAELQEEISQLEFEADQIKNDLRDHLPRSLFLAVDRRDLLEILSVQDAIADCAEDIAVLVTMRPMDLPRELHPDFEAFLAKCVDVARSSGGLVDRLDDLSSSVFAGPGAEEMLREIGALQRTEYESDLVQRTLVRRMFAMEDAMEPVALMMWLKIFDRIGDLANISERLANRLRYMLAK